MARAVQCPACGQTHPLDTLAGTPTFACAGCGRTLRTPTELVRPSGSTPSVRGSGPVPSVAASKAAPKPKATPASKAAPKRASASNGTAPSTRPAARPRRPVTGKLGVPVRVGAWVVAVGLGLLLTWLVAAAVGFLSRAELVDMFRSSTPTNYLRLFVLIPVWAFMSACLATVFIEGTRVFLARRNAAVGGSGDPRPAPSARPAGATRVPEINEQPSEPAASREPLPPGQRTRIRPREPTV